MPPLAAMRRCLRGSEVETLRCPATVKGTKASDGESVSLKCQTLKSELPAIVVV